MAAWKSSFNQASNEVEMVECDSSTFIDKEIKIELLEKDPLGINIQKETLQRKRSCSVFSDASDLSSVANDDNESTTETIPAALKHHSASFVDLTCESGFPIVEDFEWEWESDGVGRPKKPMCPSHMFYKLNQYDII